jgi:hypothetical protein
MKPSDRQTRIDFEREHRERCQLARAVAYQRTGLTQRQWHNVQQVLCFLINSDWGQGMIPYIATIAAACSMSESTVDRAIAAAKSLGILTGETRTNRSGRASNEWVIDFSAIAALGFDDDADQHQDDADQHQDDADQHQDDADQHQDDADSYKEVNTSLVLQKSSSSSSSSSETIANEDDEEAVLDLEQRWEAAKPIANRLLRVMYPDAKLSNLSTQRRNFMVKVSLLAVEFGNDWIAPTFEQLKYMHPESPQGLVAKLLDGECQRRGTRLHRELARVRLPNGFKEQDEPDPRVGMFG